MKFRYVIIKYPYYSEHLKKYFNNLWIIQELRVFGTENKLFWSYFQKKFIIFNIKIAFKFKMVLVKMIIVKYF